MLWGTAMLCWLFAHCIRLVNGRNKLPHECDVARTANDSIVVPQRFSILSTLGCEHWSVRHSLWHSMVQLQLDPSDTIDAHVRAIARAIKYLQRPRFELDQQRQEMYSRFYACYICVVLGLTYPRGV